MTGGIVNSYISLSLTAFQWRSFFRSQMEYGFFYIFIGSIKQLLINVLLFMCSTSILNFSCIYCVCVPLVAFIRVPHLESASAGCMEICLLFTRQMPLHCSVRFRTLDDSFTTILKALFIAVPSLFSKSALHVGILL